MGTLSLPVRPPDPEDPGSGNDPALSHRLYLLVIFLTLDLVAGVKALNEKQIFPRPRVDLTLESLANLEGDVPEPNQEIFLLTVTL